MPRAYSIRVGTLPGPAAPTGPFVSGTQVGVPTGTSLTTRTSLGASTGSGNYLLTHPVTGATADRPVTIWEGFRFTQTFTINPPAGQTYLMRNCRWEVPETVWTVEVLDTNGTADQMQPLVIFDHCSFQGAGDSNIAVAGSYLWLVSCDIEGMASASPASGASDGWQGASYSVAVDSNIIAGTNADLADPHSDGMQCSGTGHTTIYHCWCSAGGSAGANAGLRFGTEFGAISDVDIYYCGLDDGGYALQMRSDAGGGSSSLTGLRIVGNRWTRTAQYGPVDIDGPNITDVTWTNNTFFDGEVIPAP